MTTTVWAYVAYLVILTVITLWVGRTLRKHGQVVASNGQESRSELLDSFSHLLVVGFYLLNFGVISVALKFGGKVDDAQTAIELLSTKIGFILFVLGFVHLLMTAIFSGMRKHRQEYHPTNDSPTSESPLSRFNEMKQQTSV